VGQAEFRALGSVHLVPNRRTGIASREALARGGGGGVCDVDHVGSRVSQLDGGLEMGFRDQTLGSGV